MPRHFARWAGQNPICLLWALPELYPRVHRVLDRENVSWYTFVRGTEFYRAVISTRG